MLVNYHLREGQKVGKPKTKKVRCLALRSCHQPPCVVLTMLADKQAGVVAELDGGDDTELLEGKRMLCNQELPSSAHPR
jgi:hypothetical protein